MIAGTERLAMLFPGLLCTRKSYTTHYKAPILNTKPKFKPILIISCLAGGCYGLKAGLKGCWVCIHGLGFGELVELV